MRRLLPLCLALLLLAACGGGTAAAPSPQPTAATTPAPTPAPTPLPTPEPAFANPLTGEATDIDRSGQRPIAVMLNNLKAALPQLGVSQADIIYEVLAEGGITRMLGVYQSMEGVGTVGSIRSSRTYYLELALGHDAVYLHAGGSPDAYEKIKLWQVTALDCVNGPYEGSSPGSNLFWRDAQRKKNNGYEHSVVTTGETVVSRFADYSFRQEHPAGYVYDMTFSDDGAPAGGVDAHIVTVPFSRYKTGVFRYDLDTGRYLVEEYGEPYVDGNTGAQVGVINVLVLRTDCSVIPGDDKGRLQVDLTSGGDGWFACGGKLVPIRWSKADRNSPFVYTTADGQPLTLGRGPSYVNIIPLENEITAE